MSYQQLIIKSEQLIQSLRQKNMTLTCAESCTGGLFASVITEITGASQVFKAGFVTYSNQAKKSILSVPEVSIMHYGAVSHQVVDAMARGAMLRMNADISVAITGIAGPTGGSEEKPVGTVYIACLYKGAIPEIHHSIFSGNRYAIRMQSVEQAINMVQRGLV